MENIADLCMQPFETNYDHQAVDDRTVGNPSAKGNSIGEGEVKLTKSFLRDEQGQDLIEYTLLLAFVALASAALFIGAGNSVSGIWSVTNSQLVVANTSAS